MVITNINTILVILFNSITKTKHLSNIVQTKATPNNNGALASQYYLPFRPFLFFFFPSMITRERKYKLN